MSATGPQFLRGFHAFVAELGKANLGLSLPEQLLRGIYKLAIERCRYVKLAQEEVQRSTERRMTASAIGKLQRTGDALAAGALQLQADILQQGGTSQLFWDATEKVNGAICELLDLLASAKQDVIESIHPSLTRKYKQKWVVFRLGYDLPRLGLTAADTHFVLAADKLLNQHWKKARKRASKTLHWRILQAFKYALFNETVEAKTIEQLVRSHGGNTKH